MSYILFSIMPFLKTIGLLFPITFQGTKNLDVQFTISIHFSALLKTILKSTNLFVCFFSNFISITCSKSCKVKNLFHCYSGRNTYPVPCGPAPFQNKHSQIPTHFPLNLHIIWQIFELDS